jgi:antitoxin component YwqK of YwqJK toxin-antitoxin module
MSRFTKYIFSLAFCLAFVFQINAQTPSYEAKLIQLLSHPSQSVRDSSAAEICALMKSGKNVVAPGNVVEHDLAYWKNKFAQVKTGMPLEKAKIILQWIDSLSGGGACSGQSCTSSYRLDNTFMVDIAFQTNKENTILWDTLYESVRSVFIPQPEKFSGIWITYFVNGAKNYEINYKNGEYNGTFISYYSNGQICTQQHYGGHDVNEEDRGYYESGALRYTGNYVNGKQEGEWIQYYENGKIRSKENHLHGQFDGLYQTWYSNGQMQLEITYKKGKEIRQRAWDEKGNLEYDHPASQ